MREFTDITIMLDRSGSMSSIKRQMESALDEMLKQHRRNPTTKFTLVQFDGENPYELVFENRSATDAPEIQIHPRGATPLIDCLCNTIDRTGDRLKRMSESDRPDQVLLVVITDGQENASKTFKRQDVKDRIARQKNDYDWQFMFLGADENAFNEALTWGINRDLAIRWCDVNRIDPMIQDWASKTVAYANNPGATRGMTTNLTYTADDRVKFSETDDKSNVTSGTTTTGA